MFPPWLLVPTLFFVTLLGCRKNKKTQSEVEPQSKKMTKPTDGLRKAVVLPAPKKSDVLPTTPTELKTDAEKTELAKESNLEFGTCISEKEPEKTDLHSIEEGDNPLMNKDVISRLLNLDKTRSMVMTNETSLPLQETQKDSSIKTAKEILPTGQKSEDFVKTSLRSKRPKVNESKVGGSTLSQGSSSDAK